MSVFYDFKNWKPNHTSPGFNNQESLNYVLTYAQKTVFLHQHEFIKIWKYYNCLEELRLIKNFGLWPPSTFTVAKSRHWKNAGSVYLVKRVLIYSSSRCQSMFDCAGFTKHVCYACKSNISARLIINVIVWTRVKIFAKIKSDWHPVMQIGIILKTLTSIGNDDIT